MMAIPTEFIFYIGLTFLILFSFIDLFTKRLSNRFITLFFLIGLGIGMFTKNLLTMGLGMLIMGIFGYTLWYFKTIGGADTKLLIAMIPYLPYDSIPTLIGNFFMFIVMFGLIGSLYGDVYRRMFNSEEEIPLIPIITLVYIISWMYRIY